jgi:hypothetical protein
MLRTFTLDTNCLADIAENRLSARAIRKLAEAHASNQADVAVIAISASERQLNQSYLNNYADFRDRMDSLGLGHLNVVLPMAYWDISFWDHCLWSDDAMQGLERQIHEILFPNVPFFWQDYCQANFIDPSPRAPTGKWRNCKCDVQAVWSHIHQKRNVFVTSDRNFHKATKKPVLEALGASHIEYPEAALAYLVNQ